MMNVKDLIESGLSSQTVFVDGYLVYHEDGGLTLIDINYGENYLNVPFLRITNSNLSENLERHVSLYGGGASRLFHFAKSKGFFHLTDDGIPSLDVTELSVEDNKKWYSIDLSKIYPKRDNEDISWHDIFKDNNE